MKIYIKFATILIIMLFVMNITEAQIVNGNFDGGNTGFYSDYIYCNTQYCLNTLNYYYAVGNDASYYHAGFTGIDHTSGSGSFMIVNGAASNLVVWRETVSVQQNSNYGFKVWVTSLYPDNPGQIAILINSQQVGSNFGLSSTVNSWVKDSVTWNSGTATSATIEIYNMRNEGWGNDFGIDDISFNRICTGSPTISSITSKSIEPVYCSSYRLDTFKIKNTGSGELILNSYSFSGAVSDYSLISPAAFPQNVESGDSVNVIIKFYPATTGTKSARLSLNNNSSVNPWNVDFSSRSEEIAFILDNSSADTIVIDMGIVCPDEKKEANFKIENKSSVGTTINVGNLGSPFIIEYINSAGKRREEEKK